MKQFQTKPFWYMGYLEVKLMHEIRIVKILRAPPIFNH